MRTVGRLDRQDPLADRLADEEGDAADSKGRFKALLGLALRKDQRELAPLLASLDDQPGNLIVEAAASFGSPEALPLLRRLKEARWQEHDPRPSVLDDAIEAVPRPVAATLSNKPAAPLPVGGHPAETDAYRHLLLASRADPISLKRVTPYSPVAGRAARRGAQ